MALVQEFCINKTGKIYTVHDDLDNQKVVGQINNREAFILVGLEGSMYALRFLHPNGKFETTQVNTGFYPLPNDDYDAFFCHCEKYPYRTVTIDGKKYQTYLMRKTKNIYKADGSLWGSVASGRQVASNNSDVGENHMDWKQINYVENTSGKWVKVDGAGYSWGYVDTGIATASGYASIPFYGSW